MLQQEEPGDYVIGTGEAYSVRDFVREAFGYVGILDWEHYVEEDPRYLRPAEVDALVADTRKAEATLGWKAKIKAPELMRIMVDAELKRYHVV
jgi:GDPmannose 4,6-dehydratase